MELKQIMSQEVAAVLEEATGIVTNRLVMESLLKNGKVTIEEATFLNKLASEVITEAAEDFIPDSIEVPDAPVQETVEESVQAEPAQEQAPTIEESTQPTEEVVEESTQPTEAEPAKEELTESEAIVNNLINKLF
jgi:hypothetical protein